MIRIKDLLLPPFDFDKFADVIDIVRDAPGRNSHVLLFVPFIVVHNFIVIGVIPPVQVAELVPHLRVLPDQVDEVQGGQVFVFLLLGRQFFLVDFLRFVHEFQILIAKEDYL